MRLAYDSNDFWTHFIKKSSTIRGHIYIDEPITKNTVYLHTMIYTRANGMENVWAPFPSAESLLGYIQYAFLKEAFYKWAYGKEKGIIKIPDNDLNSMINRAIKDKKITELDGKRMKEDYEFVKHSWGRKSVKIIRDLKKFSISFNRTWFGDSREFLYMKVFENAEEMGKFILESSSMTSVDQTFEEKYGFSKEEWLNICKKAGENKTAGNKLKAIMVKNLTETL